MGSDFDRSWARVGPRLQLITGSAQLGAARAAEPYLNAVLDELGTPADAAAELVPAAFVGTAGDGRPVGSLLYGAVTTSKDAVFRGLSSREALAQGGRWLDMALHTLIADTSRAADGVGIAARPGVAGFVRMLNPPSCGRCAVLAGKWFRWNAGFARHPRCFPAGVVVSGPAVDAATRRWYQGELVVITTASGEQLPVTGNHPVLTDRGWVPAHLVDEGNYVVRCTRGQGAGALAVPDTDQVPARIEDLWSPDGVMAFGQVPTAAEDFHGDGGYGEVDVVFADCLLRDRLQASYQQFAEQEELAWRVAESASLSLLRASQQQVQGLLGASDGGVSTGHLLESLVRCHPASADTTGGRHVPDRHAMIDKSAPNHVAGHVVAAAEAVLALAGQVRPCNVADRQVALAPRWDAPAGSLTMQSRAAYADRGQDLLLRLTGQVELDRVIKAERVEWSGHVFNLTSTEGWYSANRLIVSNCDCRHIPASEGIAGDLTMDPRAAVEAGNVTGLSRADLRAIVTDGADVSQVINAGRGMYTANAYGARVLATREGVTDRGLASKRLAEQGGTFKRTPRLRPESIYEIAGDDRTEAIRLLKRFGYLT